MTRTDIANYLRLAAESVSRVFRRFQDESLIRVDCAISSSSIARAWRIWREACCGSEPADDIHSPLS
jgi:hypothetical protein